MEKDQEKMKNLYADEVRALWGDTEAYEECERRSANYSQGDWDELYAGLDAIIEGFSKLNARGVTPDHEKPRLQVIKLKQFICDRMYACTDEILAGLGQIYVNDERFRDNIDKHGEGTAAYIAECIKNYCG